MNDELRELIWSRYERASKEWITKRRSYEESYAQLRLGLAELGQTCPQSTVSLLLGIVWQLARIAIGRLLGITGNRRSYLSRFVSRWLNRSSDSRSDGGYQLSNRLTALFYYEMHKFAYLNMRHEQDFVPRTAVRIQQRNDDGDETTRIDRPYMATYSYLTGVYYLLALYNQIESVDWRDDDYELSEFYLAMVVFAKCALPSVVSGRIVRFLVRRKLMDKLELRSQGNK